MITLEMMNRLWPNGDKKIPGLRKGIVDSSAAVFNKYGLNNSLVIAHQMAQMSHECGAGLEVVENLNYSIKRMMQVWPSRFPTVAAAAPYAYKPQALANKVYNGRMGNKTGTDDGWNYRGRGGSQTTGKEGYARLAKVTGLDLLDHPDLVNDPRYFLDCAVGDFVACGCLPYAFEDNIRMVTKRLNGGYIGLEDRKIWLNRWKKELGVA